MSTCEYHRILWQLFKVRKIFVREEIICLIFAFNRRDKLWIAMELCSGGSMQDIYQGRFQGELISLDRSIVV